jgi:hypothetical protein
MSITQGLFILIHDSIIISSGGVGFTLGFIHLLE